MDRALGGRKRWPGATDLPAREPRLPGGWRVAKAAGRSRRKALESTTSGSASRARASETVRVARAVRARHSLGSPARGVSSSRGSRNDRRETAAETRCGCRQVVSFGGCEPRVPGNASGGQVIGSGRTKRETVRTPGPDARCNRLADLHAEKDAEGVRNPEGGTSGPSGKGTPKGAPASVGARRASVRRLERAPGVDAGRESGDSSTFSETVKGTRRDDRWTCCRASGEPRLGRGIRATAVGNGSAWLFGVTRRRTDFGARHARGALVGPDERSEAPRGVALGGGHGARVVVPLGGDKRHSAVEDLEGQPGDG